MMVRSYLCAIAGKVSLEKCLGVRELKGGSKDRYVAAFTLLFEERSDLILSSDLQADIDWWIVQLKSLGLPLLVAFTEAGVPMTAPPTSTSGTWLTLS